MKHDQPHNSGPRSQPKIPFLFKGSQHRLDDFEIIDDDETPTVTPHVGAAWKILVVDDDEEVHAATDFALKNITILDMPIKLIHAYSAAQAFSCLETTDNIAVALLDVVMESEDAGLQLVKKIRKNEFSEVRIVLRTGQPGYAPELSVLKNFDINDYRTKADLTGTNLISLLTTSIRSYKQLHIINESRRALEMLVQSCSDIFKRKNLEMFSQGILTQLMSLISSPSEGVVCLLTSYRGTSTLEEEFRVVTGTGKFLKKIDQSLDRIGDEKLLKVFNAARGEELGVYLDGSLGLYFRSREGKKLFVYVESYAELSEEYLSLLKVFAGNIAVGFENLALVERLDQLAFVDSVLKIPNRNSYERDFLQFKHLYNPLAVVLLHINSLSQSISIFGLPVVSNAILTVRERLLYELNPSPYSVSYDGKGDLILLVDAQHVDINGINRIFDSAIRSGQHEILLEATIAVVDVDNDMDAQTALRCATSAMIIAKQTPGSNLAHYDYSMGQGLTDRIMLQSALRHALDTGEGIEAHLQAKVDCATGAMTGAEALCRWTLDDIAISPADFIPIAEASGYSSKLTDLMLQQVSLFAHKRAEQCLVPVKVAVNLSVHDVQAPRFSEQLLHKLTKLELTPETVEFEITESVMINDPVYVIDELTRLQKQGYSIAIDDFGTGFSALNYLEKLPVNCLKIDKSFIDTLSVRSASHSLASTAITIARNMNLSVVAEGVETKEQHDALLFLGCDVCQGYYFARPMPMDAFNEKYAGDDSVMAIKN